MRPVPRPVHPGRVGPAPPPCVRSPPPGPASRRRRRPRRRSARPRRRRAPARPPRPPSATAHRTGAPGRAGPSSPAGVLGGRDAQGAVEPPDGARGILPGLARHLDDHVDELVIDGGALAGQVGPHLLAEVGEAGGLVALDVPGAGCGVGAGHAHGANSSRVMGGRRRSDDLFRGLPDDLSSGRPASRDADSWLFLPLVLRQRGATVAPRTGWTAWLPPLFTSWPGRMGGRRGGAGRSSSGRRRCAPSSAAPAARMPLKESPSTAVADDGAPCPRAAATTPTPGTPPTPCPRKSVGSRPSGPPECPGR